MGTSTPTASSVIHGHWYPLCYSSDSLDLELLLGQRTQIVLVDVSMWLGLFRKTWILNLLWKKRDIDTIFHILESCFSTHIYFKKAILAKTLICILKYSGSCLKCFVKMIILLVCIQYVLRRSARGSRACVQEQEILKSISRPSVELRSLRNYVTHISQFWSKLFKIYLMPVLTVALCLGYFLNSPFSL